MDRRGGGMPPVHCSASFIASGAVGCSDVIEMAYATASRKSGGVSWSNLTVIRQIRLPVPLTVRARARSFARKEIAVHTAVEWCVTQCAATQSHRPNSLFRSFFRCQGCHVASEMTRFRSFWCILLPFDREDYQGILATRNRELPGPEQGTSQHSNDGLTNSKKLLCDSPQLMERTHGSSFTVPAFQSHPRRLAPSPGSAGP